MVTEVQTGTIEYLSVDDIKAAPFNPPSRTEKRALTRLRQSIEKAGRIIVPLIVTADGTLADGHRRLAVAKELGMATVPVVRDNAPIQELWCNLNVGILAPRPRTWMEAVRDGLSLEGVPDLEKGRIEELQRIMGKRGFDALVDAGRSPNILPQARMIAHHCGDTSDRFVRKIINWFQEHGQQLEARKAVDADCPPDVLIAAINGNRRIREFWGME